jgi:hypothetical protein
MWYLKQFPEVLGRIWTVMVVTLIATIVNVSGFLARVFAGINVKLGRKYVRRVDPNGQDLETPVRQPVQAMMLVTTPAGVRRVKYPRMPTSPEDMASMTQLVAKVFAMGREGTETHVIANHLDLSPQYVNEVLNRD